MPRRKFRYAKLDAVQNAFFERALSYVESKMFDDKTRELITRTLLPKIEGVDAAAASYLWHSYTKFGLAKIIASYSDDLPRADVAGQEQVSIIKSLGTSFGYNVMEVRQSERAKLPLPQARATSAARAMDEEFDAILAKGDTAHNLQGFINLPNTIAYVLPNGVSGHPDWPRKTGAEILADMCGIQNNQVLVTRGAEKPDTLLLDLLSYALVSQTPFNSFTQATILETFLKVSPYVKTVIPWLELANAGAASANRMICYNRNVDSVGALIPQEMETFPPQEQGLEFVVPCHARCGGVVCYYPLSVTYADGN